MTAFHDYLKRVRAVVQSARDVLSDSEVAEIEHLIQHGEPAEGLRALAWIVVEENKRVPRATIAGIRTETEGLIDPSHLPPTLDTHVRD
jgi:hypothetical protein